MVFPQKRVIITADKKTKTSEAVRKCMRYMEGEQSYEINGLFYKRDYSGGGAPSV